MLYKMESIYDNAIARNDIKEMNKLLEIVPIKHCYIEPNVIGNASLIMLKWMKEHNSDIFDEYSGYILVSMLEYTCAKKRIEMITWLCENVSSLDIPEDILETCAKKGYYDEMNVMQKMN